MKDLYYFTLLLLAYSLLVHAKKPIVRLIDATDQLIRYADALSMQQNLVDYHINLQDIKKSPYEENVVGSMIMLQHKPVYTLGTGTSIGSGPFSSFSKDGTILDYEMFQVERAGQATYHGPGQLVIYPILDLNYFYKDINWYLRTLEDVAIQTIDLYGIKSERKNLPGYTGVWVGDSKLAAIGIKIRRW
jgi:lipoyl(octanoyl) transferase